MTSHVIEKYYLIQNDQNQSGKLMIASSTAEEIRNLILTLSKQVQTTKQEDSFLKVIEYNRDKQKMLDLQIIFATDQLSSEISQSSINFFKLSRDIQSLLEQTDLKKISPTFGENMTLINKSISEKKVDDMNQSLDPKQNTISQSCLSQQTLEICMAKLSGQEFQQLLKETEAQSNQFLQFQVQFLQNELDKMTQKYQVVIDNLLNQEAQIQLNRIKKDMESMKIVIFKREQEIKNKNTQIKQKDIEISKLNEEILKYEEQLQKYQKKYDSEKQKRRDNCSSYSFLQTLYNDEEEQMKFEQSNNNYQIDLSQSQSNLSSLKSYSRDNSLEDLKIKIEPIKLKYSDAKSKLSSQKKNPSLKEIPNCPSEIKNMHKRFNSNQIYSTAEDQIQPSNLSLIEIVKSVSSKHNSLSQYQNQCKTDQSITSDMRNNKSLFSSGSHSQCNHSQVGEGCQKDSIKPFFLSSNKISQRQSVRTKNQDIIESSSNSKQESKQNSCTSIIKQIIEQSSKIDTSKQQQFYQSSSTSQKTNRIISNFSQNDDAKNNRKCLDEISHSQMRLNTVDSSDTTQTMATTTASTNSGFFLKAKFASNNFIRSAIPPLAPFVSGFPFKFVKENINNTQIKK